MKDSPAAIKRPKFQNELDKDFATLLHQRVNGYFKDRNISKYANAEMVFKSIFMLALYLAPLFVILLLPVSQVWLYLLLMAIMGLGKAGIGLSIMHDANHGAYSNKKFINALMGHTLNLVGGNVVNWKIQHNVKHHTFTNIHEHDEDIAPKGNIIRLNPHSDLKPFHRYQFIYAWFLYGLMTFTWILMKDIRQLKGYMKDGMLVKQQPVVTAWVILVLTKLFYITYIIVLPVLLTPMSFGVVFLGFFIMHFVAGFILAVIFQPAHVMEENSYPLPNEFGSMESNWSVHQLMTTCNFAQNNRPLSWFVGGLNYQVEHHLFPNICHVHYRKIAKIVRQTAEEFGVPYKSYPTFRSAMWYHGRMLYALGRE